MKMLMTVDVMKEICRDYSVWRSALSDYSARGTINPFITLT